MIKNSDIFKIFLSLTVFFSMTGVMAQQSVPGKFQDSSSFYSTPVSNICSNLTLLAGQRIDPVYKAAEERMNREILIASRSVTDTIITLPMVVHIVNSNPASITDLQVINGVNDLNDAFGKTGLYSASLGADTKIRFCLAQSNPDSGNTTGITRTQSYFSTHLNKDIEDRKLKNLIQWDPLHYINIWLITSIDAEAFASFSCGVWTRIGVGGYATLPPGGGPLDGIVITSFGVLLAHEMGHYLGLYHTFENGCQNYFNCILEGDRVCDTPPDRLMSGSPCTNPANSCNTDTLANHSNGFFFTDVADQISNFMDYGNPPACINRFTQGQTDRMRAAIATQRSGLLQDKCTRPCIENIIAGFTRDVPYPIPGDLISFTNTSTGAVNYEWSVNGTVVSSSTDFSHSFAGVGKNKVTLKAFNSDNKCFSTSTDYIILNCGVTARFYTNKQTIASKINVLTDSIIFTNTSFNGQTFQWLISNNQGMAQHVESTNPNLTYVFPTPATYSIRLVATNGTCSDTTDVYTVPVWDPTPDGYPWITSVSCYQQTKVRVNFCIGNSGIVPLPQNTPVTFYNADPRVAGATKLSPTFYLPFTLPGSCAYCFTHVIDVTYRGIDKIYIVFNDTGNVVPVVLPNTSFLEKTYSNNFGNSLPNRTTVTASICQGQNYTGHTISGIYIDTLASLANGCDSIRTLNLTVRPVFTTAITTSICQGQNYAGHTTTGTYVDQYTALNGCDSTRTLYLTVQSPFSSIINATICAGQSYTLPWGAVATTSGIYRDTLHYNITSCDSLWQTVNLTVQSVLSLITNATICSGQSYTLPWGTVVNSTGIYRDTLHYNITGCDSIRRTINLTVQSAVTNSSSVIICSGQSYILPWGTSVNIAGIYRETLYYNFTGCDSLYRVVTLAIQSPLSSSINASICAGQTYTLPWGLLVNATGVYRDTLHYSFTGCDSLRRTVNLTVQPVLYPITNTVICAGQSLTLPWGVVVNSTGIYRDTLRYITGCDSIRRTANLIVQAPANNNSNVIICAGQSYTLPWGTVVNTPGIYRDTMHYSNTGCDSLYRAVTLTIQLPLSLAVYANICRGQIYTLPWGMAVNTAGIYRDTLHYYITGCDSLRRTVNLTVQAAAINSSNVNICAGQIHTLPWGVVANSSGIYSDTSRYSTGCDSLIRVVNLTVEAAAISNTNAAICTGETYTLPWGTIVNVGGIYKDTLRTAIGCDSLIRNINLVVKQKPSITLSKSDDINCILGVANLYVMGGSKFLWSPASSLSNATVYNPIAFPSQTTVYTIQATASNGCITIDSIRLIVNKADPGNGFKLPSAFTPNNDGKNDCFGIKLWGAVTNLDFKIFNRWGELVFSTTDPSKCWDGTLKGLQQSSAVFVYQITAETICGKIYRKGTVVLVR